MFSRYIRSVAICIILFRKGGMQREEFMSFSPIGDGSSGSSGGKKMGGYIPGEKSGKWSMEEHMRYIAFIDFNKDRMRSKEKRRSNKFYQEMSDFVASRNALQCRSHHQKLEEKYTHAIKIVNLFKQHFDRSEYRNALDALQEMRRDPSSEK